LTCVDLTCGRRVWSRQAGRAERVCSAWLTSHHGGGHEAERTHVHACAHAYARMYAMRRALPSAVAHCAVCPQGTLRACILGQSVPRCGGDLCARYAFRARHKRALTAVRTAIRSASFPPLLGVRDGPVSVSLTGVSLTGVRGASACVRTRSCGPSAPRSHGATVIEPQLRSRCFCAMLSLCGGAALRARANCTMADPTSIV